MKNNIIPIFFATDDNYTPYLSVAIKSLVDNAHPKFRYNIHILNTGLNKQNIMKLKSLETSYAKIQFNNVAEKIASVKSLLDENLRDYYSDAIFYRIFIPSLFPNYSKAIYLDCDIVVVGDISKLFFTQLDDNYLGAVTDKVVASKKEFQDYATYGVGVEYKKYFNSGMLLMNLDLMRKDDIEGLFVRLLNKFNFNTVCPDQDYLNVICKNRVLLLNDEWNAMTSSDGIEDGLYVIHYNNFKKPWLYNKIKYESYFWQYAGLTPYYQQILQTKANFTRKQKYENVKGLRKLIEATINIVNDDYNFKNIIGDNSIPEILEDKSKINFKDLQGEDKIKAFEKMGGEYFNKDIKLDPPTKPLKNVDYIRKNPFNKLKSIIANTIAYFYRKKVKKIINLKIQGVENLKGINGGAIITSNHFNEFDNVPVYFAIKKLKRKLYSIVREGNWNMPGIFGFFLKNCNTLPVSANYKNMVKLDKAITNVLKKKNFILVYPEQSMWPNYKKPRPQKLGAFHYAAKNNVPVIPCFTTVDNDGSYTIHIMPAIYPDKTLNGKQKAVKMRDENYKLCVAKYEEIYKKTLVYNEN